MNIQQIKQKMATILAFQVLSLDMSRQTEDAPDGTIDPVTQKPKQLPTEWYQHWDNDNRVRVVMHEDIFKALKADPTMEGLALKTMETVTPKDATKPSYRRIVVIKPTTIEASF